VAKIKETVATRGDYSNVKYRTIFHDVLDNKSLPEADKSIDRLSQEAQVLLAAGTSTTSNSLAAALVYLLLDQKRLQVLIKELEEAMPDISKPPKDAELEKLPYLVRSTVWTRRRFMNWKTLERGYRRDPSPLFGYFVPPHPLSSSGGASIGGMDHSTKCKGSSRAMHFSSAS